MRHHTSDNTLAPAAPLSRPAIESIPLLLLTVKQAAQALGVSTRTVETLISNGKLPSVTIGKSRRITRDALNAFASRGVASVN